MNLAKTSAPSQDTSKYQPNDSVQNDEWKKKNVGPTKKYKSRLFTWYPHHNMHTMHKPSDCFLNLSHP